MPQGFLKKSLRGFQPYTPGEQPEDAGDWVKLNTNESPLPPSPRVLEALRQAIGDQLRFYPNPTAAPARRAIALAYGLRPEQVALGNGGDELIAMCFRAFVDPGAEVAYPTPTYPLLEPLCRIHEVRPSEHPMDADWGLPASLAQDPAPLKFVVNPNSPTGTWFERAAIERVVAGSRGVVVLDEAYVDFAPESRLDLLDSHRNLLILRTMSKSYALAGLRIGFAFGSAELIDALDLVKDSYNLDRLAISAAVAAVEDREHHDRIVRHVLAERAWLAGELRRRGFEVAPSAANFLFVRPPRAAAEVYEGLRREKILVRYYDRPPVTGWCRITIGTREQHQRLLEALTEIL